MISFRQCLLSHYFFRSVRSVIVYYLFTVYGQCTTIVGQECKSVDIVLRSIEISFDNQSDISFYFFMIPKKVKGNIGLIIKGNIL